MWSKTLRCGAWGKQVIVPAEVCLELKVRLTQGQKRHLGRTEPLVCAPSAGSGGDTDVTGGVTVRVTGFRGAPDLGEGRRTAPPPVEPPKTGCLTGVAVCSPGSWSERLAHLPEVKQEDRDVSPQVGRREPLPVRSGREPGPAVAW